MAAGLGFKTFTTGEVLTAADTNGYLMQGILVFASEAARNSAITSPQEGQFAFTKDTNSTWYYDGAAWVASGASGDVTGVTAGTGITVTDSTGPVPTVTNSMATAITTNGDLIYGTGSGTFTRRGIGSTGDVLTVSGGIPVWSAPAGGGKVLQVINAIAQTAVTTSSNNNSDTGLTATITPSSASSKILVTIHQNGMQKSAGNLNNCISIFLLRGADIIADTDFAGGYTATALQLSYGSFSMSYLDSPNTTSARTYKTQFRSRANTADVTVQFNAATSFITLMEIGA